MMGVNDEGEVFEISPDPLAATVQPVVADIKLGENEDVEATIAPLLHNDAIFGVDLYEVGLAPKVVTYFKELTASRNSPQVPALSARHWLSTYIDHKNKIWASACLKTGGRLYFYKNPIYDRTVNPSMNRLKSR